MDRKEVGKAEKRARGILLELEEKAIRMVIDHSRWLDREIKGYPTGREWYHTGKGRQWLSKARRRIAREGASEENRRRKGCAEENLDMESKTEGNSEE